MGTTTTLEATTMAGMETRQRQRAWAPKTRSGCGTCRRRKIKCDETRPICRQCQSTNRECEGYRTLIIQHQAGSKAEKREQPRTPPRPASADTASSSRPKMIRSLSWHAARAAMTPAEATSLEFYASFLAPLLDATFSCSLWHKTALRISNSRPYVLHAILGFSSIYRARNLRGDHAVLHNELHQLARSQYGRALAEMRLHLNAVPSNGIPDDDTINATALVCLLFVSFHLLLGERSYAISHFRRGLDILHSNPARRPSELDTIYNIMDDGTSYFETQPLPFWTLDQCASLPAVSFSNIAEAYVHLDILVTELFQIRDEMLRQVARNLRVEELNLGLQERKVYLKCALPSLDLTDSHLLQGVHSMQQRLASWFEAYRQLGPGTFSNHEQIRIFFKTFYARQLITALQQKGSPSCYDGFERDYARTLELAHQYLAMGPAQYTEVDRAVTAGPEILYPVYLAGVRCRNPDIRNGALQLLQAAEGKSEWPSSGFQSAAVSRIIALEEEEAQWLRPNQSPPTSAADVPESVRLHEAKVVVRRDNPQFADLIIGRRLPDGEIQVVRETLSRFTAEDAE